MERAPGTRRTDYRAAVEVENCLARSSGSARAKLYKELKGRYILDDQNPLFAAFLSEWRSSADAHDHSHLAYALLALNDRMVTVTACEWLYPHLRRPASELRVVDLEAFYRSLGKNDHSEVGEWSTETLKRVAQHFLASVRDFGFASGGSKKIAIRASHRPAPIRFLLRALRIAGVPPATSISHEVFKILGIAPGEVVDVLMELNRQGSLRFRMQADVIELSL